MKNTYTHILKALENDYNKNHGHKNGSAVQFELFDTFFVANLYNISNEGKIVHAYESRPIKYTELDSKENNND